MLTDEQTDRQTDTTELIVALRNLAKAATKLKLLQSFPQYVYTVRRKIRANFNDA
jgi:hypothetical protein